MNSKQMRDKARAVVLTALMVLSVIGGSIAFTGSAVAANADAVTIHDSVDGDQVSVAQDSETVYIKATDGATTGGTHDVTVSNGNGDSISVTLYDDGSVEGNEGGDGDYWGSFTLTSDATDDESGTLKVADGNSASVTVDLDDRDEGDSASVEADYTAPADPVSTAGDAITSSNAGDYSVTVNLTDDHETGTVTVELDDGDATVTGQVDVDAETDDDSYEDQVTVSGIDASSLADGSVNVTAKMTDAAGNGNSDGFTAKSTVTKDATAPTINEFTVAQESGMVEITINVSEQLGSSDGAIDVSYSNQSDSSQSLNRSDFTESTSGDDSYVYTYAQKAFESTHSADLNGVEDAFGNTRDSSESAEVTVTSGPDYSNFNPEADAKISDDEHKISVDIDDPQSVNPDNIAVEISNASGGLVSSNTPSDAGVYFDGQTLSVYPGSDGVSALPDGEATVKVVTSDSNGNYSQTSWSFTVDSSGPMVTPGTDNGSYVTTTEPTLTFDITDKYSAVNPNTVEVTIKAESGEVLLDSATDSTAGVEFDGRTLTVDSSKEGVDELPQGEVTYIATAADSEGNLNSSAFTYAVDSMQPQVNSVSVEDSPVNDTNTRHERDVTVEFSEPMDQTEEPSVKIDVDGDGTPDVTVEANTSFGTNGFGPTNATWKGTVTLPSVQADATAEVEVVSAEDKAGLSINSSANNGTFLYDTKVPSASTNFSEDEEVNGTLDLTERFDVSGENESVTYEYNANASGGFPADDYQTVDSPQEFDTTEFDEGYLDLKVTAVDDADNADTANGTVLVDNVDPAVTANLDEGEKVYGDLSLSEAFDLTDAESVTYYANDTDDDEFKELDGTESFYNNTTNVIDTTKLDDSTNGTLGLRVEIEDAAGTPANATVEVSVNNIDISSFAFEGVEGENEATISFASNAELSDVDIVVSQNDSYMDDVEDVDLTVDDFEESPNASAYNYTATVELPRDGNYAADFNSANATDGQKLVDSSISDDANVDAEDPRVIDAQIVGANDTSTQVRVEFNEPVSSDLGVAVIGDDRVNSSDLADDSDAASGYVVFNVDGHFQTGDSPALNVSDGAFDEAYPVGDSANSTNASDATTVHTLELNLEEGHNVISVPASSGTVDLSELDALTENDTVWTYDDGEWLSYTPGDNTSSLDAMEGGQGYIFAMDHSATLDLNVYNQPGSSGDVGDATPTAQEVDEGWNLLGHWQEGSQNRDVALSTIGSGDYNSVYEQTENGRLSFSGVSANDDLEPGEGYWVFVTEDDGDAYGETAYAKS